MTVNHILIVNQQFRIKEENQGPALEALKKAIRERPFIAVQGFTRADYPFPHLDEEDEEQILKATTLIEALEIRHWMVTSITDGAITAIETPDEEKVDHEEEEYAFWSVLAPFIEPGFLECMTYENDDHWRWAFDGVSCIFQDPIISWPSV